MARDLDRILSAWALRKVDSAASLAAVTGLVSSLGAECGVVFGSESKVGFVGAVDLASRKQALIAVARAAKPERTVVVGAEDIARTFGEEVAPLEAAWVSCEPLGDAHGVERARLVAAGPRAAGRARAVAVLEQISTACGSMAISVSRRERAHRLRHQLNNQVAAATINLGYVADLVPEVVAMTTPEGSDVLTALGFASTALSQMAPVLRELRELCDEMDEV